MHLSVPVPAILRAPLFLAAGIVLGSLLAPVSAVAASSFGSGHLDWGVKASYRAYIVGPIAHGSYTPGDGAEKLGDGRIRFPLLGGSYDDATGTGEFTIGGSVRFQGHEGTLDTTFSNICVRLSGGSVGTLYANVTGKDRSTGALERRYGAALGDLSGVPAPTVVGQTSNWPSIAVTLSGSGVSAFDQYSAGEELDPLAPLFAAEGSPQQRPDGSGCVGVAPPGGGTGGGGGGTGTGGTGDGAVANVAVARKAVLVKGRSVRIAKLRCGPVPCTVKAPKSVRIKVKRAGKPKAYRLAVVAPKLLGLGAAGDLRVRVPKAARKALKGRRASVKVKLTIKAGAKRSTSTVKATLKAKR